jgi:8-oxo-dGTP pyrophosphatase MutT (NUDIX family)/broad specificity phosphatase PhoE
VALIGSPAEVGSGPEGTADNGPGIGTLIAPPPVDVPPDLAAEAAAVALRGKVAVRAAGVVPWRPAADGELEVALVHRPRYDDWSLPKGKLEPGEHPLAAAIREVAEETGLKVHLGRPLPTQYYEAFGEAKEVRYWAGRAVGGGFVPGDEVDRLEWLSVAEARLRLTRLLDVGVLDAFAAAPVDTSPMVVLRHAATVKRSRWPGPDFDRPCNKRGLRQARALVPLLAAFGVSRVISSPMRRCVQTLEPYCAAVGIPIEKLAGLAEEAGPAEATAARAAVRSLAACGGPLVVCTHGPVLPPLLDSLRAATGAAPPSRPLRKAEFVVLHLHEGRAQATELHRPATA